MSGRPVDTRSRFGRLRAHELLIFFVLLMLMALCLAAEPFIRGQYSEVGLSPAARAATPPSG